MTLDELSQLCGMEYSSADMIEIISEEREDALDAYNSEPYGNEESGLSQFVTSDVRDVIEWTLPQLMEIFYGSDLPVVFQPENAEDVDQADIESKYCAHVLESQNEGFIAIYSWFKDALIQKNGIVKAYWDEKVIEEREEYRDKTLEEFEMLRQDEEFEITELTILAGEGDAEKEYDEEEFAELLVTFTDPQAQMMLRQSARVQVVGYRTNDVSQIRIDPIPPERFFMKRDHNSVNPQTSDYCCEVYTKTRSELIEEGYEKDFVENLDSQYDGLTEFGSENINRYKKESAGTPNIEGGINDKSRDELIIFDHYIRVDFDGDGISELRLVRTNGPSGEIIDNMEVDRNIYHAITPYINTHKFHGRSLADNMMDLQKMKTQIVRGILDNLMYSVIPRKKIKGNVNTSDLLDYVPGGLIRLGQDGSVENDTVPFVAGDGLTIMGAVDNFRSERSGFSRETVGLNPQALSDSTNLVGSMIMNQSQLLVKMIASIFANTGFNSLMLHVRELAAKYEKKERIFDVAGKWVQVDPRSWRKKRSSRVKTGIGHAAKAEKIAALYEFLGLQKEIIAQQGGLEGPLTSGEGFYRLIEDIGKTAGVKDCMRYFRDPDTYQPPEQPPSLAEMTFKLNQEKLANDQVADEAEKVRKDREFQQELNWEKEKFMEEQEWEREKFEREMLYKYGESARQGVRDFLSSDDLIEQVGENNPQPEKEEDDDEDEPSEAASNEVEKEEAQKPVSPDGEE